MNIDPTPTVKNPPEQFVGNVWFSPIAQPHEPGQDMVVGVVRFEPGSRSAWHSHVKGQYLHVIAGVGRFGTRDGHIIEVHPGQTIYTPPGEEHFHAAADGTFMEHIAMLQIGEDPATSTIWAEHITDEQYQGGPETS